MSRFLSGANLSAQYYQGFYPSASVFPRLEKFLIHTTETRGWPGYGGGASAPNATYYPERREIRQHFDSNRSARALRDPSGTAVRENRDNIFQLEVICYSSYSLVERFGGLWVGDLTDTHMRDIAEIANQLHRDWDLPLQSSVTWREGRRTFYDDVRLSGPQFDAYRGILGHVHASGNQHWDPGGFRYSQLARHLTAVDQEDDDMAGMDHERFTQLMIWASRDSQVQSNLAKAVLSELLFYRNPYGQQLDGVDSEAPTLAQGLGRMDRRTYRAQRVEDKLDALLAAQDGLDTAVIVARIDQRAAESAQRDAADAARDEAILAAVQALESGDTDAALAKLRDLLNAALPDA